MSLYDVPTWPIGKDEPLKKHSSPSTSEVESEVTRSSKVGNGAWERWRKSGKAIVANDLENEPERRERVSAVQWIPYPGAGVGPYVVVLSKLQSEETNRMGDIVLVSSLVER